MDVILGKQERDIWVEREQEVATLAEIVTEFDVQSRGAILEAEEDGENVAFEVEDDDGSSEGGDGD